MSVLIAMVFVGAALVVLGIAAEITDWVGDRRDSRADDAWDGDPRTYPFAGYPPGEDYEPTDDEIYNGYGREGGISYDTTHDEPGSLGENDWRL